MIYKQRWIKIKIGTHQNRVLRKWNVRLFVHLVKYNKPEKVVFT